MVAAMPSRFLSKAEAGDRVLPKLQWFLELFIALYLPLFCKFGEIRDYTEPVQCDFKASTVLGRK